jgi:hypothetical protein
LSAGFKFGQDAVKLLVATSVGGETMKRPPPDVQPKHPKDQSKQPKATPKEHPKEHPKDLKQPGAAALPKKKKDELPSERMARKKALKRAQRLAQGGGGQGGHGEPGHGQHGGGENKQHQKRGRDQGSDTGPSIDVVALGLRELAQSGQDGLFSGSVNNLKSTLYSDYVLVHVLKWVLTVEVENFCVSDRVGGNAQVRGDGVLNSTDRRREGKGSEEDVRREKKQRRESSRAENAGLPENAEHAGKGGKGAQVKKKDEGVEAGERGEVDKMKKRRDERRQKKKEHRARSLSDD